MKKQTSFFILFMFSLLSFLKCDFFFDYIFFMYCTISYVMFLNFPFLLVGDLKYVSIYLKHQIEY